MKNLTINVDKVAEVQKAIAALGLRRVLVGVPSNKDQRKENVQSDIETGARPPINNAALAYIHDNGAPEVNIPQREFLRPGIKNAQKTINAILKKAGEAALAGDLSAVDKGLNAAGLVGQNAVQAKITDGPFQPLADATVAERARRGRKGAREELKRRAQGLPPGVDLARPLIDTAQLRASITYVVRNRTTKVS